ncbi:MAG: VWA-like domain-containing protein, partial [Granulosicoccus sp.]
MASGMIRDLLVNTDNLPETEAEHSRQWSDRLTRAHTADGEQSLMRQLLADNRPLTTPWEQTLRTCLQRSLAQKTDLSWSRPSRSWLANRGRTSNGKRMPWQPGTSSTKASPRLCIMVDVSGSVEDKLMERFANEIERVLRLLRCEIYLLIGDETVRHECRLRSGVTALRNVQFHGGGGTDFAPLILAADQLRPDIGIFLTDLDGPAGDEPKWEVIWAIPESADHRAQPFGRLLVLN